MTSWTPSKRPVIEFGPTAGLVYENGRFFDPSTGEQIDPANRPSPITAPAPAAAAAPPPSRPLAPPSLPSFDPPAPQAAPALGGGTSVSSLPSFSPPAAASPLPTFQDPAVSPVGFAPPSPPFVAAPSGGLILAQDYTPAPIVPGYAQARSGVPFTAPQAADIGNLFARMTGGADLLGAVYGRGF
ncbi:hypothetical protein E2493_06235 [Sphingomonas parva]|uniref:Uncharacterized protein n=1 Tax=Sphingomonas parva TaxID=2555898 RepID=A0A4Y8ZSX4_9SPHN|nr:hypothetical protein [Sphingomonas parva]TFI59120.1 hypothetical protein E2493_06235 [Sphingomonas parva]